MFFQLHSARIHFELVLLFLLTLVLALSSLASSDASLGALNQYTIRSQI